MLVKQKVKYTIIGADNKRHNMTETYAGRNADELRGRVEKHINQRLHQGWELR